MLPLLLPRHDDPRLRRKLLVARLAFALVAAAVVALLTAAAADGELPGLSSSRRTAGSSLVRRDESPRRFLATYLAHLAIGVALVSGLGWMVERSIVRLHVAQPPARRRYPY